MHAVRTRIEFLRPQRRRVAARSAGDARRSVAAAVAAGASSCPSPFPLTVHCSALVIAVHRSIESRKLLVLIHSVSARRRLGSLFLCPFLLSTLFLCLFFPFSVLLRRRSLRRLM